MPATVEEELRFQRNMWRRQAKLFGAGLIVMSLCTAALALSNLLSIHSGVVPYYGPRMYLDNPGYDDQGRLCGKLTKTPQDFFVGAAR